MNHTKLIHQFFDGGIDGADEDALFSALAGDTELRREFVEHLKIASFIQHDTMVNGPPSEVSNAVFSALGLPQPDGTVHTGGDESAWQKLGVLFQRILPFIATVFITAAVTTGVFLLSDKSPEAASGVPSGVLPSSNATASLTASKDASDVANGPASQRSTESETPMADNAAAAHGADASRDANAVARPSASLDRTTTPPGNAIAGAARTEDGRNSGRINAVPLSGEIVAAAMPGNTTAAADDNYRRVEYATGPVAAAPLEVFAVEDMPPREAVSHYNLRGMPHNLTPFSIANVVFQLRMVGLQSSYPDAGLPDPTQGVFRHMAITGMYKLSERHALGITYGREPFGRIYSRTVVAKDRIVTQSVKPGDLIVKEFRDNDMLDWGGVTWKMSHTGLGIARTVYPFTEITAAVSKYGPIGRAMVGIELYPSNESMINIGVELASLGYVIEDTWYSANTLGGSLGIAVAL